MAGYSGTPLIKKLGIKEGFSVVMVNAPKGFPRELGELPTNVEFVSRPLRPVDFIIFFTRSEKDLAKRFNALADKLTVNGMIWVAWPKKSSGVPTTLSFDLVQRIGLGAGLVDVKICAVSEVWSGLKFVYRLKDRQRRNATLTK